MRAPSADDGGMIMNELKNQLMCQWISFCHIAGRSLINPRESDCAPATSCESWRSDMVVGDMILRWATACRLIVSARDRNLYVELDVSTLPVACDRCFIRGPPNT